MGRLCYTPDGRLGAAARTYLIGLYDLLKSERTGRGLALAAFISLLLVVGPRHEPWFDEAQAWLIARDNSPWTIVTSGVRYEGTPALWHLLLWSVQRLALPYSCLWLISACLATAGAWIVLFKSPFPLWLSAGLIFSYFFAYQYSIVARSYSLDLLFVPLLAWLFEKRAERPISYALVLALIANTNAHSFVLSNVLALEWAWTARRQILKLDRPILIGLVLYGVSAVAAVLQAFPPTDINFVIRKPGDMPALRALLLGTEAFVERYDIFSASGPTPKSREGGCVLTILILAPCALLFSAGRKLALSVGMFGVLIGFSAVKYGNFWHAGIIFLSFVFCLWITWEQRHRLSGLTRGWLIAALAGLVGVQVWWAAAAQWRDFAHTYSPAHEVALFLARRPQGSPETLGVAGFKAFAVQPYFSANIFSNYRGGAPRPAYYLWRRSEQPIPGVNEDRWRKTAAAGFDRLLLSSFNLMGSKGRERYSKDALDAGYCPSGEFFGELIWKTYVLESDNMMVFDRCTKAVPLAKGDGRPPV